MKRHDENSYWICEMGAPRGIGDDSIPKNVCLTFETLALTDSIMINVMPTRIISALSSKLPGHKRLFHSRAQLEWAIVSSAAKDGYCYQKRVANPCR